MQNQVPYQQTLACELMIDCVERDNLSSACCFIDTKFIESGLLNERGQALYQTFLTRVKEGKDVAKLSDASVVVDKSGCGQQMEVDGTIVKFINCWDNLVAEGICTRHQRMADGHRVTTSPIVFESKNFNYVYTKSGSTYQVICKDGYRLPGQ